MSEPWLKWETMDTEPRGFLYADDKGGYWTGNRPLGCVRRGREEV